MVIEVKLDFFFLVCVRVCVRAYVRKLFFLLSMEWELKKANREQHANVPKVEGTGELEVEKRRNLML